MEANEGPSLSGERIVPLLRRAILIDVRALAVCRIGLGLVILADLIIRGADFAAHYTDQGILPQVAWSEIYGTDDGSGRRFWWSLFFLSSNSLWAVFLYLLAFPAAVALIVGYRTRIATVVTWALLVSLHHRNPAILTGADTILRVMLFWAMFLPLGKRWSLDVRRRAPSAESSPSEFVSVAGGAFLLQLALMYWVSALHKWHPVWVTEGSAIYYALNADIYVKPFGEWVRTAPEKLLRWMTIGVYWFEWFGPLLAFSPWRRTMCRTVAVLAFCLFHFGLGLTLELGTFPWVCMALWGAFLPSRTLDWLQEGWHRFRFEKASGRRGAGPRAPNDLETGTPPEPLRPRRALAFSRDLVLAGLFLYVVAWNLRELDFAWSESVLPRDVRVIGRVAGLDQSWKLFAPYPLTDDGWPVIVGELANGRTQNLFDPQQPLTFEKPEHLSRSIYRNQRWRKYLSNLRRAENSDHYPWFTRWLKEDWDRQVRHDPKRAVRAVHLLFQYERTAPPGDSPQPVQTYLLHQQGFDGYGTGQLRENRQGWIVTVHPPEESDE